ncbi:35408_t:CDS:2 [Gigaspora margarita]|uniref:35408_t:CDS:1 n=1 Tax=Gigaspora margarita TaxID=4874 RepID=A0ABN7WMV8_GIGMA|nr:35408_t:CDS:2 [Gigaspora margarita]
MQTAGSARLTANVYKAESTLRPTTRAEPIIREAFKPELLAALQLVMYRFSICESGASYGTRLKNLKYRNKRRLSGGLQSTQKGAILTKSQKYVFGAMTIGGPT